MRKLVLAALAATVMAGLVVPWVGAEAARPAAAHSSAGGDDQDRNDKLLFFASDGMRQDAVESTPTRASCPASQAAARRHAGVRQRPADPGAAEHRRRLVHADHRRLAGRPRLDQQHVPHQRRSRSAQLAPSGASRDPSILQAETLAQAAERGGKKVAQIEWAGGRSGVDQRPDARLPQLPLRPRRGDQLHRADRPRRRSPPRSACSSTIRPGSPAARRSRAAPSPRPAGPTCRESYSPAQGDAPARARRLGDRQVRPQRLHLRQPRRPQDALRPRAVLAAPRTAPTRSPTSSEGEWADVKVKIASALRPLDGKTGAFLVKVERLDARPLPGAAVPHVGHPRDRDLAELAGRARLHRQLRGLRRRAASRPRRPATSPCSSRGSSARTPTSSRASTGRRSTTR